MGLAMARAIMLCCLLAGAYANSIGAPYMYVSMGQKRGWLVNDPKSPLAVSDNAYVVAGTVLLEDGIPQFCIWNRITAVNNTDKGVYCSTKAFPGISTGGSAGPMFQTRISSDGEIIMLVWPPTGRVCFTTPGGVKADNDLSCLAAPRIDSVLLSPNGKFASVTSAGTILGIQIDPTTLSLKYQHVAPGGVEFMSGTDASDDGDALFVSAQGFYHIVWDFDVRFPKHTFHAVANTPPMGIKLVRDGGKLVAAFWTPLRVCVQSDLSDSSIKPVCKSLPSTARVYLRRWGISAAASGGNVTFFYTTPEDKFCKFQMIEGEVCTAPLKQPGWATYSDSTGLVLVSVHYLFRGPSYKIDPSEMVDGTMAGVTQVSSSGRGYTMIGQSEQGGAVLSGYGQNIAVGSTIQS